MPLIKLYFAPALLLLVLSCPLWQLSQSLPMLKKGPLTDSCVLNARALLQNITAVLSQDKPFRGINCTMQSVELNTASNTPSVCSPKGSTCNGITISEFNQESCLTNIGEDLRHYYKFLAAYPGPIVLPRLREFMENCFPWSLSPDLPSEEAAADRDITFNERQRLCKVLKGFHVRTITINRVIGHINSS